MLTQCPGLLQHGDVEVGHSAARLLVLLDQSGKFDGAGQTGWSGTNDHDVHLDRLGAGGVGGDQAVNREGGLVANREDAGQTGLPKDGEVPNQERENIASGPASSGRPRLHSAKRRYIPRTMQTPPPIPGFRGVPFTGVIYVMAEATRRGYRYGHPDWCNLGQGQPETGPLPGGPPRIEHVAIDVDDQEYAPVPGIPELREAVASLYNSLYRRGMKSQYKAENVCICGGGRSSLTRAVAALGEVNLGHFLPDYTAYEELLDIFKLFTSIPVPLDPAGGYRFSADDLRREITGQGAFGGAAVQPEQSHRPHRAG